MIHRVSRSVKRIWARITLLSLELIVIIIAFFAALAAFIFVAQLVFLKQKDELDLRIFRFLATYVSDVNTNVMQAFSFLGTHYFLIPANFAVIAYFLFIRRERWYSIKVPAISITSLLIMSGLKEFFHRDRPLVPLLKAAQGLSFPSGHAMMSSTFYGLIIYLVWRNISNKTARWIITTILLMLIFFIGLSRIYLRVHYPTDVMAGFSLGLIWLVLSISILNKMERISRKEIDLAVEK